MRPTKKWLSILLTVLMIISILPVGALADESVEESVTGIQISFTVSNKGVLAQANDGSAMVNKTVFVQDLDNDGIITVDEALKAAHSAFNTEEGYAAADDYGYGLSVSKLWGVETMNTLFFVNGVGLSVGVGTDTVKNGDMLLASVNADDMYYADWYTAFDKTTATVDVGEELILTLTGGQGMGYPADFTHPVQGVKAGTWNDGTFKQNGSAVIGEDGKCTLKFAETGTYIVTASGTVKDTVTDWSTYETIEADCPIIAPACVVTVKSGFASGSGTETDPYLISSTEDLSRLSLSSTVNSYANTFFKFVADVALPAEWTPIGTASKRFSGTIDGDGHLLTVPAGEKALLGATENAALKNLNIYGENIIGNGVVSIYTTGSTKPCILIENVTLKTGTVTSGSGFVGGYASGSHAVTIRGCTVEKGVTIGDGTASNIGSFGGDFNGSVVGCVSHADVRGVDYVGGICGSKGQTMGDYVIVDCIFAGTVTVSGNYAGGISGGGYAGTSFGLDSAPNTPCVTILNCLCSGSISGADYVGGILGAEPGVKECWNNGVGYIQSNLFTGTLSATGENAAVGGIIGYLSSLNNVMVISDNFYLDTTASKGIGRIEMVETPETSGSFGSGFNKYTLSGVKYGRTDDPTGADADKLAKAVSETELTDGTVLDMLNAGKNSSANWTAGTNMPEFAPYGDKHLIRITCTALNTSGGMNQVYPGEADVLEGKTLTLHYSDGSTETIAATDDLVSANWSVSSELLEKYIPASLTVGNHELVFNLYVKPAAPTLKTDINPSAEAIAVDGGVFQLNLNDIFEDPNGLELSYTAKLPGAKKYTDIETVNGVYRYQVSGTDSLAFAFKAKNSGGSSSDVYSVALNVCEAKTIEISVTVSNKGTLAQAADGSVMAKKLVSVKDLDDNGVFTVDEALQAVHAAYLTAGGYAASDYGYGLSVTKLWGVDTMNTLFFVNGAGLSVGVGTDTVKAGDELIASVNADDTYYADWYTFFTENSVSVNAGEKVSLHLKGHLGMAYTEEDLADTDLSGLTVKTVDGTVLGITGNDGYASVSFDKAGTYIVTASGTVKDAVTDWSTYEIIDADCPIIAPACVVTVAEKQIVIPTEKLNVSFKLLGDSLHDCTEDGNVHTLKAKNLTTWLAAEAYEVEEGSNVLDLLRAVEAKHGDVQFNYVDSEYGVYITSVTYGNLTIAEFDNGPRSGWMYTLNGQHPDVGVDHKYLSSGDVIVFHYTDDYTKEEASEQWDDDHETEPVILNPEKAKSFIDVPKDAYYADAVAWAVKNKITTGVDEEHFDPNSACTREQVVTFLWRAAGCPVVNYALNYEDVAEDTWYTEAVRWAVSAGITNGVDETHFGTTQTCSRAQVVTFLFRFDKTNTVKNQNNTFKDVEKGAFYYDAVLWALENSITKGTSADTFGPAQGCTRAQVVTFLYRYLAE